MRVKILAIFLVLIGMLVAGVPWVIQPLHATNYLLDNSSTSFSGIGGSFGEGQQSAFVQDTSGNFLFVEYAGNISPSPLLLLTSPDGASWANLGIIASNSLDTNCIPASGQSGFEPALIIRGTTLIVGIGCNVNGHADVEIIGYTITYTAGHPTSFSRSWTTSLTVAPCNNTQCDSVSNMFALSSTLVVVNIQNQFTGDENLVIVTASTGAYTDLSGTSNAITHVTPTQMCGVSNCPFEEVTVMQPVSKDLYILTEGTVSSTNHIFYIRFVNSGSNTFTQNSFVTLVTDVQGVSGGCCGFDIDRNFIYFAFQSGNQDHTDVYEISSSGTFTSISPASSGTLQNGNKQHWAMVPQQGKVQFMWSRPGTGGYGPIGYGTTAVAGSVVLMIVFRCAVVSGCGVPGAGTDERFQTWNGLTWSTAAEYFDIQNDGVGNVAALQCDGASGTIACPGVNFDYSMSSTAVTIRRGLTGTSTITATNTLSPVSTVIGHWGFNEGTGTTTADLSNNGNTGTLQASPTWWNSIAMGTYALNEGTGTTVHESIGTATGTFQAGATTSWVNDATRGWTVQVAEAATTPFISFTDSMTFVAGNSYTFEGWIKITSCGASASNPGIKAFAETSFAIGFTVGCSSTTQRSVKAWNQGIASTFNISTDAAWHLVQVVYTGGGNSRTIYVDGVSVGTDSGGTRFSGTTTAMIVGDNTYGNAATTSTVQFSDLRVYNYALLPTPICKFGDCLGFVGSSSQYVSALPVVATSLSTVTYTAWFQTSVSGSLMTIFSDSADQTVGYNTFAVEINRSCAGCVQTYIDTGSGPQAFQPSSTNYADGNWHFIAATYTSGSEKLYVDGTLLGTGTGITGSILAPSPGNSQVSIGDLTEANGSTRSQGQFFTGLIDDIWVFSSVLTSAQLTTLQANTDPIGSPHPPALTLACSGLPVGMTCSSFSVNPVNPTQSSTLTIATTYSVAAGTYTFIVTDQALGLTTIPTTVTVTVTEFITISNNSPLTINQGFTGIATISVTLINGPTQSVSIACSGLPAGITCNSFNPSSGSPSYTSSLTIGVSQTQAGGTYTFSVTNGVTPQTTTVTVIVPPYDFALSSNGPSNSPLKITRPLSGTATKTVIVTATLTSGGGQPETFTLSCAGLPAFLTCGSLSGSPCTPTCSVTVVMTDTAGSVAQAGVYTITITPSPLGATTPANIVVNVQIVNAGCTQYPEMNNNGCGAGPNCSQGNLCSSDTSSIITSIILLIVVLIAVYVLHERVLESPVGGRHEKEYKGVGSGGDEI